MPEQAHSAVELPPLQLEKDLNDLVPVLAHGLIRRLDARGLRGRVRIQSAAGEEWGVASSPQNPAKDIPDVIVYPREYLEKDKKLVNARLRHEIGNLNYPIEGELPELKVWCKQRHIAPSLMTALLESVHESSVNYLEMRNSHSDRPAENFRALYEQEIPAADIAAGISEQQPYKQALDLTLLYGLTSTGVVPTEIFDRALEDSHPSVRGVFDRQTRSLIDQSVKLADPKAKVRFVRDFLWTKFSPLVGIAGPTSKEVSEEQPDDVEQIGEDDPDDQQRGMGALKEKINKMNQKAGKDASETREDEQGGDGESDQAESEKEGSGEEGESDSDSGEGKGDGQEPGVSEGSGEGAGDGESEADGGEGQGSGKPGAGEGNGGEGEAGSGEPSAGEGSGSGSSQGKPGKGSSGSGQPGGGEGGGMPSKEEMQDALGQMQEMLGNAKSQVAGEGSGESGQAGAIEELQKEIDKMKQGVGKGADPKETMKQMQSTLEKLEKIMDALKNKADSKDGRQGEPNGEGGQAGEGEGGSEGKGAPGASGEGESSDQSHESFQQGGATNEREISSLFERPNPELVRQVAQLERSLQNSFSQTSTDGERKMKAVDEAVHQKIAARETDAKQKVQEVQKATIDSIKDDQRRRLEAQYREMSNLSGEALSVYATYMESMRPFIDDLTEFFIDRFKLDRDFVEERYKTRGARLQRGFQKNILGGVGRRVAIRPESFERRRAPEKPNIVWTLIIDNSGSCAGEIIEQEKRMAIGLMEVAKKLDIPFELVTFGGEQGFVFLKSFEDDVEGDDLQKIVLLQADQGTPDVETLEGACQSMRRFSGKFLRSYNFVYFMTDGQSGGGSIQEIIERYKRDMVISGIGLAEASGTIRQTWGKNALEVPDVKQLNRKFVEKVERQIDETFD